MTCSDPMPTAYEALCAAAAEMDAAALGVMATAKNDDGARRVAGTLETVAERLRERAEEGSDARKRTEPEVLPITVPAAEWGHMAERATNAELEAAHLREALGAALILLSRTEDAFRAVSAERDGWQRDAAEHAARATAAGYRLNNVTRERDALRVELAHRDIDDTIHDAIDDIKRLDRIGRTRSELIGAADRAWWSQHPLMSLGCDAVAAVVRWLEDRAGGNVPYCSPERQAAGWHCPVPCGTCPPALPEEA